MLTWRTTCQTGSGSCWTPNWSERSRSSPAARSPILRSQSPSGYDAKLSTTCRSHSLAKNLHSYITVLLIYPYPSSHPSERLTLLMCRYNIVFPCMMMSTLTVLVFCMPPDSGEKIALGVTVILAFSVFMLAIAERMPETSESIPLIGI